MTLTSTMLIREKQTDLSPFPAPDLSIAHTQWLQVLSSRMNRLDEARNLAMDMNYCGTTMDSEIVAPLEEAVDEARRMVCALGGEMRRRSEGVLPPWSKSYHPSPSVMVRANTAGA